MDNTYKLIISFVDGDVIEITGVMSHEMREIGDCVYMFIITNKCNHYINFSTVKYIGKSLDLKQKDKTPIDIYVRDKSTGEIHRVGDDIHDSLDVVNGKVSYYNLQNGCGTSFLNDYNDDEYEFVNSDAGTLEE